MKPGKRSSELASSGAACAVLSASGWAAIAASVSAASVVRARAVVSGRRSRPASSEPVSVSTVSSVAASEPTRSPSCSSLRAAWPVTSSELSISCFSAEFCSLTCSKATFACSIAGFSSSAAALRSSPRRSSAFAVSTRISLIPARSPGPNELSRSSSRGATSVWSQTS